MSNNFQAGDVVQLNSGSPALTVLNIRSSDAQVVVTWYNDATNDFKIDSFPAVVLSHVQ